MTHMSHDECNDPLSISGLVSLWSFSWDVVEVLVEVLVLVSHVINCLLRLVVPPVFLFYVIPFQAGFLLETFPVWCVAQDWVQYLPPPKMCPVLLLSQSYPPLISGFDETARNCSISRGVYIP